MMTNDKRRALHDQLAGSVVIKEEYWQKANQNEAITSLGGLKSGKPLTIVP